MINQRGGGEFIQQKNCNKKATGRIEFQIKYTFYKSPGGI